MDTKNDEITIPELLCEGCKNRDKLIQNLAEHIDRQNAQLETLKKEFLQSVEREMKLAA